MDIYHNRNQFVGVAYVMVHKPAPPFHGRRCRLLVERVSRIPNAPRGGGLQAFNSSDIQRMRCISTLGLPLFLVRGRNDARTTIGSGFHCNRPTAGGDRAGALARAPVLRSCPNQSSMILANRRRVAVGETQTWLLIVEKSCVQVLARVLDSCLL